MHVSTMTSLVLGLNGDTPVDNIKGEGEPSQVVSSTVAPCLLVFVTVDSGAGSSDAVVGTLVVIGILLKSLISS